MDSITETKNVPATQQALAKLAQFRGNKGMVFARREDIEIVAPQYEPVVTFLELAQSDFTHMGHGNMYPGKSATNRIGDATGVSFLEGVGGCREEGSINAVKIVKQTDGYWQVEGAFKVIATAQGERLKPDGTPRRSTVQEYAYDVITRCNMELIEDFKKPADKRSYPKEIDARKRLLELQKFSYMDATTGVQLRVIRELAGVPTAFTREQLGDKPVVEMCFSQVIENNRFKIEIAREIMRTPDGRAAIVQALFGLTRQVYGPQRPAIDGDNHKQLGVELSGETAGADPAPAEGAPIQRTVDAQSGEVLPDGRLPADPSQADLDFDDDIPGEDPKKTTTPELSPTDKLKEILKTYLKRVPADAKGANSGKSVHELIDAMVSDKETKETALNSFIDRLEAYCQHLDEQKKGGKS